MFDQDAVQPSDVGGMLAVLAEQAPGLAGGQRGRSVRRLPLGLTDLVPGVTNGFVDNFAQTGVTGQI